MKRQDLSPYCTGRIETEINFRPLMLIIQVLYVSVGLAFHIQIMVQDICIVIQSEEGRVRNNGKMKEKGRIPLATKC